MSPLPIRDTTQIKATLGNFRQLYANVCKAHWKYIPGIFLVEELENNDGT